MMSKSRSTQPSKSVISISSSGSGSGHMLGGCLHRIGHSGGEGSRIGHHPDPPSVDVPGDRGCGARGPAIMPRATAHSHEGCAPWDRRCRGSRTKGPRRRLVQECRGLQTDGATKTGRDSDRPCGVGPDRGRGQPGGESSGTPPRGSARDVRRVPRVRGGRGRGSQGEFVGAGLADQDAPASIGPPTGASSKGTLPEKGRCRPRWEFRRYRSDL